MLAERDPGHCWSAVTRMSEADASVVRAFFTSFGCCGVIDPIDELPTLGLVKETA